MKLLALHLTNVRRFTGKRASITGIGDGITVVSEANEFGKSTFFDAIHALFLEKYSSAAKPVKSLQPYAKGAVEISADVDTDEGQFRLEKRFLSGSRARVSRISETGHTTPIAQDDEAERWIAKLLGAAQGGPMGLLWVRQGLIGLEPESAKEKTALVEARRDLLSSVAGEIDTMTGGRRMDRVMKRVAESLGAITTARGGARGPWKDAQNDIATLEAGLTEVEGQVNRLSASIAARKQTELALGRLKDPDANTRRKAAQEAAQTAFDEAKAHAGKITAAQQQRDLAAAHAKSAKEELDRFLEALTALETAQTQEAACAQEAAAAKAELARLQTLRDDAAAAFQAADAQQKRARASLDQARRFAAAKQARETAATLTQQVAKATEAKQRLETAQAKLGASKTTANWLTQVESAAEALTKAQTVMATQLTRLQARYDGAARVRVNGAELAPDEAVALEGQTEIDLPGIGRLTLEAQNASAQDKQALADRKAALEVLLAQGGTANIQEARAQAEATRRAATEVELGQTMLKTLAPNGLDALSAALAEAKLAAAGADEASDAPIADLEAQLTARDAKALNLSQNLAALEAAFAAAREALVKADTRAEELRKSFERAQSACGPPDEREATRSRCARADAQTEEALKGAQAALQELETTAPDLETAQAELKRAKDAVTMAAAQLSEQGAKLAGLTSEISTLAGNGIEERRDELVGQLATARETEQRFARQAEALTRLRTALDDERAAARETYFGPVQKELRPLLSILHADAALDFDGDSLLPTGLRRDQAEETLVNLSGGTKEQIAILTRLAFARLFAQQGRQMPIILDDALVYSDDDRIIKMFTALTRVAQGQQIIVFSCRQLAFQDLGGARPTITVTDV